MLTMLKKLNASRSAFFLFSLSVLLVAQTAKAKIMCRGSDRAEILSRTDVAAGAGSGELATSTGSQTGAIINSAVDLNIQVDVASFAHGEVTVTTDWVWRVQANKKDNLTGFIVADYQFSGLVTGDNKICSSPTSCFDVVSMNGANTSYKRQGSSIQKVQEAIELTLNLAGGVDSGTYTGQLSIELFNSPNADGTAGVSLSCDKIQ